MPKILIIFLLSILFSKEAISENNYFLMLKNNKVNVRYGPGFIIQLNIFIKKNFYLLKL